MKIAAKISAGYGILIALIVAVLTYQVALFYQMQSINRDLSAIDFRTAILSLQLLRDLDQVEEFTRKFYATEGDPDYAKQLQGMRNACSQRMAELKSLAVSAAEGAEIAQLSRIWDELSRASAEQQKAYDAKKLPEAEAGLSAQLNLFSKIQVQAQFVIRATRRAIESRLEQSTEAGRRAQRISWMAAAAALVLSLAGAFWIVGSISGALRRLTAGTRAVAEGKFLYQLEEKGNDELASLTRDFNSMTRRLSELDNLKKDFVSHVSHELKTPLASVQETICLLLDEIPGPLNEQQRRFLELNLQSSKRLSSLIGNLLDVSKMDAGVMRYQMQQHELAALVRTVLDEFEAPLRERSFQLQAEIPDRPVPVNCDADRMIQVLSNLLGNALK